MKRYMMLYLEPQSGWLIYTPLDRPLFGANGHSGPPWRCYISQTLHGTAICMPISWGGARGVNVGIYYMAVPWRVWVWHLLLCTFLPDE